MLFNVNALLQGFKRDRRSSRRMTAVPVAAVQQLEPRTVPTVVFSGIISVSVSGSTLTVNGDAKNNNVQVDIGNEGIAITGFNGTKVSFGGQTTTSAFIKASQLPNGFNLGSFNMDLKAGDDVAAVFVEGVDVKLSGNALINLGSGNDAFCFFVTDGTATVDGLAQIIGGAGNDTIGLSSMNQNDISDRYQGGFDNSPADVNITVGTLQILDSTGGDDSVGLLGLKVNNSATITLGSGTNHLGADSIGVGGSLSVTGGSGIDRIGGINLKVDGLVSISTLGGNDVVGIDNAIFGSNVQVFAGTGNDLVLVGSNVSANPNKVLLSGSTGTNRLLDETAGLKAGGATVLSFSPFNAAAETAAEAAGQALLGALTNVFKLNV